MLHSSIKSPLSTVIGTSTSSAPSHPDNKHTSTATSSNDNQVTHNNDSQYHQNALAPIPPTQVNLAAFCTKLLSLPPLDQLLAWVQALPAHTCHQNLQPWQSTPSYLTLQLQTAPLQSLWWNASLSTFLMPSTMTSLYYSAKMTNPCIMAIAIVTACCFPY